MGHKLPCRHGRGAVRRRAGRRRSLTAVVTTPDPCLGIAALRRLRARRPNPAVEDITARIEAHLAAHDGYVAFSGGKDSLVVLDLARRVDPDVPVVFFDSGLDYPETYDYLTVRPPRGTPVPDPTPIT